MTNSLNKQQKADFELRFLFQKIASAKATVYRRTARIKKYLPESCCDILIVKENFPEKVRELASRLPLNDISGKAHHLVMKRRYEDTAVLILNHDVMGSMIEFDDFIYLVISDLFGNRSSRKKLKSTNASATGSCGINTVKIHFFDTKSKLLQELLSSDELYTYHSCIREINSSEDNMFLAGINGNQIDEKLENRKIQIPFGEVYTCPSCWDQIYYSDINPERIFMKWSEIINN